MGYSENSITCGANRGEFEDQRAIKGNLNQIGIKPIQVSHLGIFLGEQNVERGRRRDEKRRRRGRREESQERYGFLYTCMECYNFVRILGLWYGLVWISMVFYGY